MDKETITYRRTITGADGNQHNVEIVLDPQIMGELLSHSKRFQDIRQVAEARLKEQAVVDPALRPLSNG